jgi:hypothetical protein
LEERSRAEAAAASGCEGDRRVIGCCVAGARYIGRGPAPAANGRRSRGSWVGCRRMRLRGQWMRWVREYFVWALLGRGNARPAGIGGSVTYDMRGHVVSLSCFGFGLSHSFCFSCTAGRPSRRYRQRYGCYRSLRSMWRGECHSFHPVKMHSNA